MPQQSPSQHQPSQKAPTPNEKGVPNVAGQSDAGNPTRGAQVASGDKPTAPIPPPTRAPAEKAPAPTPLKR